MTGDSSNDGPLVGDLTGAGKIINSEVAKRAYDDALSPAMREVGQLSEDTLKAFRLFTAPLQLAAAYQDRFKRFCDRVRAKVPDEHQQEAPPEIVRPVMEAFASTSDESPLMDMFEELLAKAIDDREADKLSPQFPVLIRSLSPLQARMVADLATRAHVTDDLVNPELNLIVQRVGANIDFSKFGDHAHHLTLSQDLKEKNIVKIRDDVKVDKEKQYPNIQVPEGLILRRTVVELTMFGHWFASACVAKSASKPR